jgi:hypothetical protein
MLNIKRIQTLEGYKDFFRKALHDFERYSQTRGVYELADCLLTLNSLPEWIRESKEADSELKMIAAEKIIIMQASEGFQFDEYKLNEIDHQLRFIRLFCNHTKHAARKEKLPKISMGARLPATFPITFDYIEVGETSYIALDLIRDVIEFWRRLIVLDK